MDHAHARARDFAWRGPRRAGTHGIRLAPLKRGIAADEARWTHVHVAIDRALAVAHITVNGPDAAAPNNLAAIHGAGAAFWPLALARELDDAILHLRFNEPAIGTWVFHTRGDAHRVVAYDRALATHAKDWFVRETILFLKRVFKRLDVSARSILALIEPGSCFAGTLLELALAADRSYMLAGAPPGSNHPAPTIALTAMNFGSLPMCNDLTRLATRFLGTPEAVAAAETAIGRDLNAAAADALGLVTFTPDDIDWEDEVRLAIEERRSFSPDALTGLEASLRFAGPETLETKIFGRLSAWQNWIFQRPNAVGPNGALKLYGTGRQAEFDKDRV
jgi:benzoyl-CoA-dihydrodiol lyase